MRYLLDTNVVSEIRHPEGSIEVKRRIGGLNPETLFTSAIVFAELTKGVLRLPKGKRKTGLIEWLNRFEIEFGDRILAFDRESARIWGGMVAEGEEKGRQIGVSDGQIAATGIQHGLVVVTRNISHFSNTGARLWNVWDEASPAV